MNRPIRMAALVTGALGVVLLAACTGSAQLAAAADSGPTDGHATTVRAASTARTGATAGLPAGVRAILHRRLSVPFAPYGSGASGTTSGGSTVQFSANWSGEVQLDRNFTSVSGSWTVPSVLPSSSLAAAATWVGIGGDTGTTVIQTGTIGGTSTGRVGYGAWVDLAPEHIWTLTEFSTPGGTAGFVVGPGDVMDASVTSTGTDQWLVKIEDTSRHWTYSHTFIYTVSATSADWVTERPGYVTTSTSHTVISTLADYRSTRFTHLETASGAASAPPAALTAVRMEDAGNVISSPGPVSSASSATGESFTDSYLSVPARVYGSTSDGTAAVELEHQFTYRTGSCPSSPTSGRAVVLATDQTYPDALASAYLASYLRSGTLLTPPTSISAVTLAAIRDEGITHVYVVGGDLAVSTAVVSELESISAYSCGGAAPLAGTVKLQVTRIAGATEYDTALEIAEFSGATPGSVDLSGAYAGVNVDGGDGAYNLTAGKASASAPAGSLETAILATGTGFQDAEAASTLAYAAHLPVLLTTPSVLSAPALSAIETLHIRQVVVMGGQFAVSDAVVSALEQHGVSVLRIAGADGTQTAIELARCELGTAGDHDGFGWAGTGRLTVARGDFYGDGVAGAVVAADGPSATAPEPLLLTASPTSLGDYLATFLESAGTSGLGGKRVTDLTILGGVDAVSQTLANTMMVALLG